MSILIYEKRLPHSKNGQWRMAAKYPHSGCMSDHGVAIIVVVVVVSCCCAVLGAFLCAVAKYLSWQL